MHGSEGSSPAPLEIAGGEVRLGARPVLHDVSLSVEQGEFLVLLGHNGSGKTTLVKALLGLVPLSGGEVRLFGDGLGRFKGWDRIGYVPQRVSAVSGVPATVREVVLSGRASRRTLGRRSSATDGAAARRALEAVDLVSLEREPVTALSGGQQQRVLIARALARDPDVLVLDEPVASVDLAHQESFSETLRALQARGTSVLLVAHRLGTMQSLVNRAVVLEEGRIIYSGAPDARLAGLVEPEHHHQHPADARDRDHEVPPMQRTGA